MKRLLCAQPEACSALLPALGDRHASVIGAVVAFAGASVAAVLLSLSLRLTLLLLLLLFLLVLSCC